MAKTDFKTIEEYHRTFGEQEQQRMNEIRQAIHEVVVEAEEVISYQIPAFKYKGKFLLYYSAYTKHITLSSPWSAALLENFKIHLAHFKVTKSAIQLPYSAALPMGLIKKIAEFRKYEIDLNLSQKI